jgi:hypothetical protein
VAVALPVPLVVALTLGVGVVAEVVVPRAVLAPPELGAFATFTSALLVVRYRLVSKGGRNGHQRYEKR